MEQIQVDDIVTLKKQHPCGSYDWLIMRIGAEVRLKCMGCGHQIMMKRSLLEKSKKGINRK